VIPQECTPRGRLPSLVARATGAALATVVLPL